MTVHIRFSAPLARVIGAPRLTLALDEGATLVALRDRLCHLYPDLAPRLPRAVAIIDGRTAPPDTLLQEGEQIAFLLPVAGGAAPGASDGSPFSSSL